MKFCRLIAHLLLMSLLWLAVACAPSPPPPGPPPEPPPEEEVATVPAVVEPPEVTAPPRWPEIGEEMLSFADQREQQVELRLAFYQQQARKWRELDERLTALLPEERQPADWRECRQQLPQLRDHYHLSRELLRDLQFGEVEQWPVAVAAFADALSADLAFQDSDCAELYQQVQLTVEAGLQRFQEVAAEQLETVVFHHAAAGRSEQALQALANLERQHPEHLQEPLLLARLGRALARAGALEQALELLASHDVGIEVEPEMVSPGRLRADLLLLAGRSSEAREEYEAIAARHRAQDRERQWVTEQLRLLRGEILLGQVERELFLEIMRDYILYDGKAMPTSLRERQERLERLYPGGKLTHRVRQLVEEIAQQASRWLDQRQREIEELLARRDYSQAIQRLQELQDQDLPAGPSAWVREQLERALEAQRQEEEQRHRLQQQALTIQWEEANRLLGLRRYDEAITAFSRLLATGFGDEARLRIQEAAQEAATELRREAAGLFVRARRADAQEGRELAAESWRLLRRIIDDYPDSEIIPRVRDNLRSVEEYLEGLEEGALEELRESAE